VQRPWQLVARGKTACMWPPGWGRQSRSAGNSESQGENPTLDLMLILNLPTTLAQTLATALTLALEPNPDNKPGSPRRPYT